MESFTKDASVFRGHNLSKCTFVRVLIMLSQPWQWTSQQVIAAQRVAPLAPTNAKLEAVRSSRDKIMLVAYQLSSLSASI
jgi:hypothetical protein